MKIVLCGIGDREAENDCFGPDVIDQINETPMLSKIDCGVVPENYLNKIIDQKPDLVIFFDTLRSDNNDIITLIKNEELLNLNPGSTSTHSLPFSAIYMYLNAHCRADIMLFGVKPSADQKPGKATGRIAAMIANRFQTIDAMGDVDRIAVYEILSHIIG